MQSLLSSLPEENGTPASSGTARASLHKVCCFAVPFRQDITHIFHAYSVYGNANASMSPCMTPANVYVHLFAQIRRWNALLSVVLPVYIVCTVLMNSNSYLNCHTMTM